MNGKTKKLLNNLGILAISNFSSKILVFLMVPLYTSVLTTTEYGIFDLIVSTVTFLVPILSLNIIDAVMRFLMDKSYSQNKVITIGMKFVISSIVMAFLLLFILHHLNIGKKLNGLEIYIFFYYLFYLFNQYFIQMAKGLELIKYMGIAGILGTVVMILFNILFLVVFNSGLSGFLWANILAQAIPAFYLFLKIKFWRFINTAKTDAHLTKEMLMYCVPLIASVIGWWINSNSDKYIVTIFCGVAANGVLSVAYKLPSILTTLQGIFIQAWQISAIKEYGGYDTKKFYGQTFFILNVLMCATCSWLIVLTKPLAQLLYAKNFYTAWQYTPFLLISSVINCASGFLGPILSAKKDSRSMAMSAIYGASINLVLNIIFIYFIGIQGVTIATVIASYIIYQVRKCTVGSDIVIDSYAIVLLTWILLCIQAFLEIYTSLWYIEGGLMIIMFVLNIKRLRGLLSFILSSNPDQAR